MAVFYSQNRPNTNKNKTHKVSTPKVPSQRRSTPLEPNFHTTLEKLEGWRPPQLPRLAWHSLLDIANLVFNYAVLEPADIVRHLKEGSVPGSKSVTLKYVEDLRDMTMDQCTSLYQWLTLFVNREMLEKDGPGHALYSEMLNDKIWSEVVAVHSLVWDWWFESPHTVMMYVQGPNWESFADTFKPKEVLPKDCVLLLSKIHMFFGDYTATWFKTC